MSIYYCRQCAANRGMKSDLSPDINVTGSFGSYLHDKFVRHTQYPESGIDEGILSIFDTDEYQRYKDYIVNTHASGSVEVDNRGRKNILIFATEPVGKTYKRGEDDLIVNGIKVVFPEDPLKVHGFPAPSAEFSGMICEDCGTSIYVEVKVE